MNANLKAFLDMIAYSELGEKLLKNSDNGYNVIVGGSLFATIDGKPDYRYHPKKRVYIKRIKDWSTAAGRYQILLRYWNAYKEQLNLKDFGHASQDAVAIQLIKECRAIKDIEAGRFAEAVHKCNSRWASLPGAGYNQHENEIKALQLAYANSGGTVLDV
jgi:muramidase (phage lysozyme)